MKNFNLNVIKHVVLGSLCFISFGSKGATAHASAIQPVAIANNPVPINQQRYLGVTIFNFETDPHVDDERIENSASIGCNSVEITINWDKIYPTRQSLPNWKVIDSHVQTAIRLGLKIALRIHVGREMSYLNGFWGTNETMKAADGSRMTGGGITQFSYAHQPTVDLAKAFVKETMQRYQYLQPQNRLLFMSVVASPALESEYSPVHTKPDGTKYSAAFDYSDPMKLAFRDWLKGRFSLTDLNKRWNTTFGNWNDVVPPTGNLDSPYNLFSASRRGQDWYVFRHRLLENFLNEITATIKSVDGSIRVINQHGAVWDNLSGLRGTYAFKSLDQQADGLKFNDGPTYNHRFSMDVVRSNLKPYAFMINAVDGMFYKTASLSTYFDQVTQCFDHGASMITLANFGAPDARPMLNQLAKKIVAAGLLNSPVTQVQIGGTISYKLSEILRDSYPQISSRWGQQFDKFGKKPVQVTLIEDLLDETNEPAPTPNQSPKVVQPFPDQTATVGYFFSCVAARQNFTDPDGAIAKVEITGLPAGLSYNTANDCISGMPTLAISAMVMVKATDDKGATVSDDFLLTVKPALVTTPSPAPIPNAPQPVTGNFEGYLDKVECGTFRGWVWDRNKPNTPLMVEFFSDGLSIGTAESNIYRSDLVTAGKGDGRHAYSFTTPAALKDNKTHQISATIQYSSYTLKYAPKALICPSSVRFSAESERGLEVTVLGNPVKEQVEVEAKGATGQMLRFQLNDTQGRIISERLVERAGSLEYQRFRIDNERPGILILRVTSGQQAVTIKLLKQ